MEMEMEMEMEDRVRHLRSSFLDPLSSIFHTRSWLKIDVQGHFKGGQLSEMKDLLG
jgi:hypothetical protein